MGEQTYGLTPTMIQEKIGLGVLDPALVKRGFAIGQKKSALTLKAAFYQVYRGTKRPYCITECACGNVTVKQFNPKSSIFGAETCGSPGCPALQKLRQKKALNRAKAAKKVVKPEKEKDPKPLKLPTERSKPVVPAVVIPTTRVELKVGEVLFIAQVQMKRAPVVEVTETGIRATWAD